MAVRIDTDLQAVYIYEPLGHTLPAMNAAWAVAGLYRFEADVNEDTLVVARYGETAGSTYVGLFLDSNGVSARLRGNNGGGLVQSATPYTFEVGREYRLTVDYDAAGTVRLLDDGAVLLTLSFTPNAGTSGQRSLQWGGYGEVSGYTSCTIARWRFWDSVLTESENRAEFRSLVPVKTSGLLGNWPMDDGGSRFINTVSGEPDLAENTDFPVDDGAPFIFRPGIIGTPVLLDLGETATPGARSVDVPANAQGVLVFIYVPSNGAGGLIGVDSISGDFCGTFTVENLDASTISAGGAVAKAAITSTGAAKQLTIVLEGVSTVADAGAMVVFIEDADTDFAQDLAVAHAAGDGSLGGFASADGLDHGVAIALDMRLNASAGGFPPLQNGWTSVVTGETGPGALTFYACARLVKKNITSDGVVKATTQNANGSVISLATLRPTALANATRQTARPDADLSDGAWTPSTGADLYATIDEATPSDIDYISVASNSECELGLGAMSTPAAGAQQVRFKAKGSGAKALVVGIYRGATLHEEWTIDPLSAAVTEYIRTLATPITDTSDLRLRAETVNAGATPTPTVSFGSIGTGANGGATLSVPIPAGSEGDYLTLHVTSGATSSATPSTPDGWTLLATGASTDGTFGGDTGPRRATVFGREADGTEAGNLPVTITGGNTCRGTIIRWPKSQPTYIWDVQGEGADDSTSGTGVSAATASINWATGDHAVVTVGQRVDSATQSAQALSASGTTFGTLTNRASVAVTTGNDHRHVIDSAPVTTGGGAAATTWAYTASAAVSAGVAIVRLREVAPTEFARLTFAEFTAPEAAGGTDDTADGVTMTAAASLIPGSASAVRSPTQAGATLTAAASLIAGLATGQTNITADGVLVSAAASLIPGAASGVQNPTAAGQTLVAAASLIPGAASGVRSPTAAGQVLTAAASLIAGAASSGTSGTADGVTMVAAASLVAGSASGVRNATAPGATMTAGASMVAGAASAVRSHTQAGVTLSAAASLIAGAASADNSAVAPGALLTAGASLLPGAASAVRNAQAFGAFLELLTSFEPGSAISLSSDPSIYVAYVPRLEVIARVPTESYTAFVPADDAASEVPPGDYTATV